MSSSLGNILGMPTELERLGRLKAQFPGHRIRRGLSNAGVTEFTAVTPDGTEVHALSVASLARKLQQGHT